MTPKLTAAGKDLLRRALTGETINFTKMQLGNGTNQDPESATALVNPFLTVEFSECTVGDVFVTLKTSFTNSNVSTGFRVTELGYFATDPDDSEAEILYAIGYEDPSTADYIPDNTDRILEMKLDNMVYIGDAENVTAAISGSLVYATKEEFDEHTGDTTNPHQVTAAQVGLGNVPNVSTNNQTPTFTEASVLNNISSGERLSVIFGKIKYAITNFINHLANRSNPHQVTAAQAGAAALQHTHSTDDLNRGILSPERGGTGYDSLNDLFTSRSSVVVSLPKSSSASFGVHDLVGINPAGKAGLFTPGSRYFVGFSASAAFSGEATVPVIISGVVERHVRVKVDDVAVPAGTRLYPGAASANNQYLTTTEDDCSTHAIFLMETIPAESGTYVENASVIII